MTVKTLGTSPTKTTEHIDVVNSFMYTDIYYDNCTSHFVSCALIIVTCALTVTLEDIEMHHVQLLNGRVHKHGSHGNVSVNQVTTQR